MKFKYLDQEIEFVRESDNAKYNTVGFLHLALLEYIRSLRLGGSYLDIGSNFGTFGVYFSRFCNSRKVYCYETEKHDLSTTRENIEKNVFDGKCNYRQLEIADINRKLLDKHDDVSVITLRLDEISSGLVEILRGILSKYHPVVFVRKDADDIYLRLKELLMACGYIESKNAVKEAHFNEFISSNYEHKKYFDVSDYWESRYQSGRNSGSGSYGRLAKFKSRFINNFIAENEVFSTTELGCGDGAQLSLIDYPKYKGLDISPAVISICNEKFCNDPNKEFFVYSPGDFDSSNFSSDLSISLDVIYHLSNDEIYYSYLRDLFSIGIRYVIIFSNSTSNYYQGVDERSEYIRFRDVVSDIATMFHDWKLVDVQPNPYPFNLSIPDKTSFADFFVFEKQPKKDKIFNRYDQLMLRKTSNQLSVNAEQADLILRESKATQKLLASLKEELLEEKTVANKIKELEQKLQDNEQKLEESEQKLEESEQKLEDYETKELQFERERERAQMLEEELSNAEATIYKLYHSLTYQLATHIRNVKTARGLLRFPLALLRLYRTYLRRKRISAKSSNLGKGINSCLKSKEVDIGQPNGKGEESSPRLKNEAGIIGWPDEYLSPDKLNVLAIMDEFTSGCFAADVNLIQPRPDNWRALFDKYPPAFVFIESAWKGNFGSWQYRVGSYANKPGNELKALSDYAKRMNIPVIFWNKEDPVHHEKFIEAAGEADVIFTTDEDMISSYKRKTGNSRIYPLPFAAQPKLHRPFQLQGRLKKACFAGSWYGDRHAERGVAMEWLLDAAEPLGLDIYDRNFGTGIYPFPDKYSKNVIGSLPYNQLCSEYGRYRVFLNVNSVTDSPTMFSRRVFELLASGTPVVSTYAKGIERLLGLDLVWLVRNREEAQEAISILLNDDEEWRRRSIAGIRAVFSEHTYLHRLQYICEVIGIKSTPYSECSVLLLAKVSNEHEIESLSRFIQSQSWKSGRMYIELTGDNISPDRLPMGISTIPSIEEFPAYINSDQYQYVSVVDPSSFYDENYLQDLVNATRFSPDANVWGKSASEMEFTIGGSVYKKACLWRTENMSKLFFTDASDNTIKGEGIFAIDNEGFSLNE